MAASSVDTREAAKLAASKKRAIGAPSALERRSVLPSATVSSGTRQALPERVRRASDGRVEHCRGPESRSFRDQCETEASDPLFVGEARAVIRRKVRYAL